MNSGGARATASRMALCTGFPANWPQVEPGWLLSQLPESPPEEAEPFSSLLEDLERLILPAVTHWQHPRFFAYFANTGSEAAIAAELLAVALNQVGILWRTSPALAELTDFVEEIYFSPRTAAESVLAQASERVDRAINERARRV